MAVARRFTRHIGLGLVAALMAVLGLGVHPAAAGDRSQAEPHLASSSTSFAVVGHPAVRPPSPPVVKRVMTDGDPAVVTPVLTARIDAGAVVAPSDVLDLAALDQLDSLAARAPPVEGTSRS